MKKHYGDVGVYGLDKPISLEQIAKVDLSAALWAFRAVYPEQRTLASRSARLLALRTFNLARSCISHDADMWVDSMPIFRQVAFAGDYLLGLRTKHVLEDALKEVYPYLRIGPEPLRLLANIATFALGSKPVRRGTDILEALLMMNPYSEKKERLQYHYYARKLMVAMQGKLLEVLEPRDEEIGPVARGFDGSFTSNPKSQMGNAVRAYRHKTTIRNMLASHGI